MCLKIKRLKQFGLVVGFSYAWFCVHYQFWFEYVSESVYICLFSMCVWVWVRQVIFYFYYAQMERFNWNNEMIFDAFSGQDLNLSLTDHIQCEIVIENKNHFFFTIWVFLFSLQIWSHESYSWYFYFHLKNWHLNCPDPNVMR